VRVLAASADLLKYDSPFPGAISVSSLHDAYIEKPPGFSVVCGRRKPARCARCKPYRQGRCIRDRRKVTYPGTNNYTQWTYDGFGRRVSEVETRSGSITSTKQFVWCGTDMCEARNSSSAIMAQYFESGETIAGTSYYFDLEDIPGSTTEVTNNLGATVWQSSYDPYGRSTVLQGTTTPDFQYAGYYYHAPSGLNLTLNRAYSPTLGRWLNRDPIEEEGGVNLYDYCDNDPVNLNDPSGQSVITIPKYCFKFPSPPFYPMTPPDDNGGSGDGDNGNPDGGGDDPPPPGGKTRTGQPKPRKSGGGGGGGGRDRKYKKPENVWQNKQFNDAVKEINRLRRMEGKPPLTFDQVRRLHDDITGGQNTYHDIIDIGMQLFG
jgi:RHS repeat-associated protein